MSIAWAMNTPSDNTITLTFHGQMILPREVLVNLIREALPTPSNKLVEAAPDARMTSGGLPRLAFSIRETAEILGLSDGTVYRFLRRGLLKSSTACRQKLIPKTEIERFLKETCRG